MRRRDLLKSALSAPVLPMAYGASLPVQAADVVTTVPWDALSARLGDRFLEPRSPFAQGGAAAQEALKYLCNPYYLGDEIGLAQSSGWLGAWTFQPSRHAVAARDASDVVAAVEFAKRHRVRLVVRGGGHSYHGTSSGADALLVWTRRLRRIEHHDAFVGQGCEEHVKAQPAVSLGAGCVWMDAYHAVTTLGGRYVQGGGCPTVGVAGLVQSGGFGHFSKTFGTASANLLEAEVVTADGRIRIANAYRNPELFWGLKGGGGGSLGIVTRVTLRTFDLPEYFGGVGGDIRASSDDAYKRLITRFLEFYRSDLFNPNWGEHVTFGPNVIGLTMMFQGLNAAEVEKIWAPFWTWVRERKEYTFEKPALTLTIPARHLWDGPYFKEHFPGHMRFDDRPGAPTWHAFWEGEQNEAGRFTHGYRSLWLSEHLLTPGRMGVLVDALFDATRHSWVEMFFGKGLAGGAKDAVRRTRDTAMNPQVLDAFALAILATGGSPNFPGMPEANIDAAQARDAVRALDRATAAMYRLDPGAGSYLSESDFFLSDWKERYWGGNAARLARVKRRYDPQDLFLVHQGIY